MAVSKDQTSASDRDTGAGDRNPPGLRICAELRAAFLERVNASEPRETLYFARKYDLVAGDVPANCYRVTLRAAVWRVWTSRASTLDLPEPLWIRFLPQWILLAAAWKLRRLRGREGRIGVYAIENNDVEHCVFGVRTPPRWFRSLIIQLLSLLIQVSIDRIAFGSDAAQGAYQPILARSHAEVQMFRELPMARLATYKRTKLPLAAAFVGPLEERKGLSELMNAWPLIEQAVPGASLTIAGDGPMKAIVSAWAARAPQTRRVVGQLRRDEVLQILDEISVVVAPSKRAGRWREQVGNAITEGLAAGATIVTTTETGLSRWLSDHGHAVVTEAASEELVDCVVSALRTPLDPDAVRSTLPPTYTRLSVDRWLHDYRQSRTEIN